ncbi:hypothetical protein [Candidatus Igneacidithiobacillus taiwanensis]|uniref:hypothetical protein n=1 Tax=Candidatus Igneacidithiobacillus taiwanensis TaxID=1945924 RepID=UPI00289C84A0|nr:hypothetical protein [Candidatus Igneacidithiobacillus taiwanensis]
MRTFLARLIFLILLVAIVLLGIAAIQHPHSWQEDWQNVRAYFVRHWAEWRGEAAKPAEAKAAAEPKPATSTPLPPLMAASPSYVPPTPLGAETRLNDRQLTLLMAARQAFWMRDYPVAIGDYQALINARPDRAALYGELGNVLWAAGQRIAAANAYGHAGKLLLQQGRYAQAAALIPILTRLNPEAATQLQAELAR